MNRSLRSGHGWSTAISTALVVALFTAVVSPPAFAQTQTWDGGSGGTGTELGTAANWTNDTLPSTNGGTAVWNGTTTGSLSLVYSGGLVGSAGDLGLNFSLASGQTGNVLIDGTNAGLRFGNITVAAGAGALTFGGGSVGGTFTLTLAAGASNNNAFTWTNDSANPVTLNNDVVFGAGGGVDKTITFAGSGNWVVNNNLACTSNGRQTAVIKSGAGALTIAAANTSTTGVTLNSGTLNFNHAQALGTGTFTLTGGVLDNTSAAAITNSNTNVQNWNGDFAFTGTKDLDLGTGAVTLGSSRTVTVNGGNLTVGGTISGAGFALTKAGAGTLTLTGSNGYSGGTNLNGGVLSLGNAGALGSTGTIAFGGGTLRYGSANQADYSGRIRNSGGAIAIDTNSQSIAFASSLDNTNTGGLTKSGSGTLSLTGVNTYTGTTTVAAGVLAISDTTALPGWNTAGRLVVNTGAALYVGNAVGDASVTTLLTTGSNFRAGATIGFDTSSGNRTLGASVADTAQGSLGLTKVGANSLTLSAGNTYTGTTTVSAGSLVLSHSNAVVNSTLALGGSGVVFDSAVSGRTYNVGGLAATSGTVDLVNNAGSPQAVTLTVGGNNASTTFNGVLAGTTGGALVKAGTGTLTLGGANSYTGNTTVNAGTLLLGSGAQLYATSASGSVTINSGATLSFTGDFGFTATFGNLAPSAGSLFINGGTLQHYGNGNAKSSQPGAGRLFTIGALGATIDSATPGQEFSIGYRTDYGVNLAGTSGGSLTLTGSGNGDMNFGIPGSGGVVKNGSGTWRLTGTSSSYTGGTQIYAGTLQLGSTNALGAASGSLAVNGGSLNLAGNSITVGTLSGSSGATITTSTGAAVLTASGNTDSTYAGTITGALGLTKSGSGTLSLTGVNTYMGTTTVAAGVLRLGADGAFASSPVITVGNAGSSGAILDLAAKTNGFSLGAGQTLAGGGTVRLAASGTLNVLGTFAPGNSPGLFTFDGGSTLLSGTTTIEILGTTRATDSSQGSGFYDAVNLVGNGTLQFGGLMSLEFSSLFPDQTTFALFNPANGSLLTGNFSGINVTGGFYTGLTWNQTGTVWKSSTTTAGQSLEFNAVSGNLVIVPEPGALVLGAMGVLAASWGIRRSRKQRGACRAARK